ncbi:MAG: ABC transporter permease subunit, partial [Chthoniobacteraceae bacterium]
LMGFNFQSAVTFLNQGPTEATLPEVTFYNLIFWFIFPLIFPLITMRTFADEYRMGTIETLSTAPVNDWQIVLSKFFGGSAAPLFFSPNARAGGHSNRTRAPTVKFFGAVVFYIVLFLPSFLYFALFTWISGGNAPLQSAGAYWSTYMLLLLLGMFFVSIGILASSLVKDQVNAAIISLAVILLYLFIPSLLGLMLNSTDPRFTQVRGFLSPFDHMRDFARGMVDTRQLVWYLSMTALLLVLTHQIFQSRKLKAA